MVILCPKCCNENKELLNDEYDPQWFVIAYDVNLEDEKMYCDHCNGKMRKCVWWTKCNPFFTLGNEIQSINGLP